MQRIIFRIVVIFMLQAMALTAQMDEGTIVLGQHLKGDMAPGGRQEFGVNLDKGQFAFFELTQLGVDLVVKTVDKRGKVIEIFDSPYGKYGPEYFSVKSKKKGLHRFIVEPHDPRARGGSYVLYFRLLRPEAIQKEAQVDELFLPYDNTDSPGASVAITRGGEVIFKKGYGMANLEYDIPITPSTVFHIASVSKQFTAFSILLLEADGLLSLDDDVRKYIPEVPQFGKTITLRHLAHHTSGLRDQWNLLAMAGWRLDDVITKEHILKLIGKQLELNFDPGEEFLYCNTGYTLLAEVVERVSGISFAEFTQNRIFKPLKMSHSFFYDDHEKLVKNRAYSYYQSRLGFKKNVLSYATVGASSLFTNVEDLGLWALNFHKPKIGDEEIFEKMTAQGVLNNGKPINYALGLGLGMYKGLPHIGHGGADAGYRTYLGNYPSEDLSVIVLSNDASFEAETMARKISDIYLSEKIDLTSFDIAKRKSKANRKRVSVPLDTLQFYIGEYELQPGLIITVSLEGDQLFAQPTGQPKSEMIPLAVNEFEDEFSGAQLSFKKGHNGEVDQMTVSLGRQHLEAARLDPFDLEAVDISEYVGRYYSEELSTAYEFILNNREIIARHQRNSDIVLRLMKEDTFAGSAWYFSEVKFERDELGKVIGCKVTNGRVRNLRFKKMDD